MHSLWRDMPETPPFPSQFGEEAEYEAQLIAWKAQESVRIHRLNVISGLYASITVCAIVAMMAIIVFA